MAFQLIFFIFKLHDLRCRVIFFGLFWGYCYNGFMNEQGLRQYVTKEKGTEPPFSGKYVNTKDKGVYKCANCGEVLFSSETKFDSDTGWPSFTDVASQGKVELKEDHSGGMNRVEAVCKKCGAHLGHVFDDGPKQINGKVCTGKRYCINSVALEFDKKDDKVEE